MCYLMAGYSGKIKSFLMVVVVEGRGRPRTQWGFYWCQIYHWPHKKKMELGHTKVKKRFSFPLKTVTTADSTADCQKIWIFNPFFQLSSLNWSLLRENQHFYERNLADLVGKTLPIHLLSSGKIPPCNILLILTLMVFTMVMALI